MNDFVLIFNCAAPLFIYYEINHLLNNSRSSYLLGKIYAAWNMVGVFFNYFVGFELLFVLHCFIVIFNISCIIRVYSMIRSSDLTPIQIELLRTPDGISQFVNANARDMIVWDVIFSVAVLGGIFITTILYLS